MDVPNRTSSRSLPPSIQPKDAKKEREKVTSTWVVPLSTVCWFLPYLSQLPFSTLLCTISGSAKVHPRPLPPPRKFQSSFQSPVHFIVCLCVFLLSVCLCVSLSVRCCCQTSVGCLRVPRQRCRTGSATSKEEKEEERRRNNKIIKKKATTNNNAIIYRIIIIIMIIIHRRWWM